MKCQGLGRLAFLVVAIERVSFQAKAIPRRLLVSAWMALTDKSFPKVKAFQLEDADFDRVIELRRCKEDEGRELEEWGRVLSVEGTDACVFNTDEIRGAEYAILIRKSHYHDLREVIRHELSHIAQGDL